MSGLIMKEDPSASYSGFYKR